MVRRAGCPEADQRRSALSSLLERYLPVLRFHLMSRGRVPRHQVDDLLQEFLLSKIIESEIIAKADQGRGRFRSFLITAMDRFAMNCLRDQRAVKRQLDRSSSLEAAPDPVDRASSPADQFDLAWARQVLGQAVRRMQLECKRSARADVWQVFRARVLEPTIRGSDPVTYSELVRRFNLESPTKASNILVTANRMFARVLRTVIGTYERDERDINEEIQDLLRILGRSRASSMPRPGMDK